MQSLFASIPREIYFYINDFAKLFEEVNYVLSNKVVEDLESLSLAIFDTEPL